ncbi:MAG: hypothetical protein WKF77_00590 [Planctomycetaceae bacterium]
MSQAHQHSALSIFVAQFRSLIVALLVVATAIAFAMGDHIEAVAILVVIVINAAIGFLTEWKAERALSSLQKQAVPIAHVIRDGTASEIPAAELVPGDLVVLAAGARVPADGRIVECGNESRPMPPYLPASLPSTSCGSSKRCSSRVTWSP